jgi:HK97 family phage major capsid protein/HK97 family phage prohead protease
MTKMPILRRDFECELRAEKRDDGGMVLRGYAVVYNRRSLNLGGFTEVIKPGAFANILRGKPDVVALFNHDSNNILGRTPNTLRLKDSKEGLFVEIDLPDTEMGRSVHTSISRGDIKGQSFAFSQVKDSWNKDFTEREIHEINGLHDVGPVTYPAYPDTSIAARDRQQAMEFRSISHPTENQNRSSAMDPKQMREQAQQMSTSAEAISGKAIFEKRDLTGEEIKNIADLNKRANELLDGAKALEDAAQLRSRLAVAAAPVAAPAAPVENRNLVLGPQTVTIPMNFNLRSFTTEQHGTHAEANAAAHRSGMFILASLFRNERAQEYCRQNGINWNNQVSERAAGISINAKGGYLVPNELESAIINVTDKYGVARQICRPHRMVSDTMTVPIRSAGVTAYAVGESASITASDKTWGNAELVARKWAALCKMSSEISEDSIINVADDLAMEIGVAFAGAEDDCFLNGDGTSTYHGIQGIHTLIEAGSYSGCFLSAAAGHDTLAELTADDLALLYGAMPEKYSAGGIWLCKSLTKAAVFDRLMAASGGNTNQQLANGQPMTYMGFRIVTNDKMYAPATPSTVANTLVPILFGRFDIGVSMGLRRGITLAVSTDRYFETDEIAIRGTERFDISAHNANCGSDVGPIVGLELNS